MNRHVVIPPIVDPQKPEDDFVSQLKPSPLATASGRSRLSSMDQQLRDSNGHDSQPTEAPLDLSSKQQSESPVSSLKSSVEGPLAAGIIKCIETLLFNSFKPSLDLIFQSRSLGPCYFRK